VDYDAPRAVPHLWVEPAALGEPRRTVGVRPWIVAVARQFVAKRLGVPRQPTTPQPAVSWRAQPLMAAILVLLVIASAIVGDRATRAT
jgi:hypothetical protein